MAQLPPRVPTITANWPDFSHQKMESLSINPNPNPSWVDDFLDFSSTRRGSHRRSMSDDEQLMTMFNDDVGLPSSPSDHNSNDGDDKHHLPNSKEEDTDKMNADPKRIKRILANRQSAQRSRVRKLHYISELERSVTSLQGEVSVLSPRVAFLDHQRLVLNVDNTVLKQRIAALAQDKIFKDAHQEALKREIERLRQIYYQQKKIGDNNSSADKEQLAVN